MRKLFAVLCVALLLVACTVQPPECDENGNLLLKACTAQLTYYPKGNDENGESVTLTPSEGILESGARYVFDAREFNLNDHIERNRMCLLGRERSSTSNAIRTPSEAAEVGQHYVGLQRILFDHLEDAFLRVDYCPETDSWMLGVDISALEIPPLLGDPGIIVIHRSDGRIVWYGRACPFWMEDEVYCPDCGRNMRE